MRYSGRQNLTRALDPDVADEVWRQIEGMPVAAADLDLCWKCLDASGPAGAEALITRGDGDRQEWAFLKGDSVLTRRGGHAGGANWQSAILLSLAQPMAALWPTSPGTAKVEAKVKPDWRRCTHPAGYHAGDDIASCQCGSPLDASTWLPARICLSSTCYNYAVKDVWCQGFDGIPVGATPRRTPATSMDDYAEWTSILSPDGLLPVPDHTVVPAGMSGGWHVALTVNAADFHFLRLDGAQWSHKFGARPPQTCDAAGAAIPAGGLGAANLCDYQLVGYFYAPGPLAIDH
jgi:hypothetical protein